MPAIGVLTLEIHLPDAHSLKDKRQVIRSLKDRLRKHNVSVAEIDFQDLWQRSVVAVVTISFRREQAEIVLQAAEREAAGVLSGLLQTSGIEWIE
jgi:uncharacterized protein